MDKMREVPPITDETYKSLMVSLGMPNNRSLLSALQQIANHATQRAAWQAAKAYPKDKPVECANGCPDKQVCDYCQSTAAAMMPCGASVTNVYEAYEAGKKAAKSVPVVGDYPGSVSYTEYLHLAGEDWDDDYKTIWAKLQAEVETKILWRKFAKSLCSSSITRAELDALRKDAERYAVVRDSTYCDVYIHEIYLTDDDLDDAIDAAIAGEKK